MKKKYKIVAETNKTFSKHTYSSFEELLQIFKLYDINKPYKILDGQGNEYTDEFNAYLDLAEFKLLEIKHIKQYVPKKLLDFMNQYWDVDFYINPKENVRELIPYEFTLELLPDEDLKSAEHFWKLWNQNLLTIGFIDEHNYSIIIDLDKKNDAIYLIDTDKTDEDNIVESLLIGWNNCNEFISDLLDSLKLSQ